ncbi:hypothetical protein ABT294_10785 [Nonomuraea sp. NPDC000554]|uniref:hypothetical protein n=1 Tax=Nonomuraea sp. NPDC000554 TaxID=3154259 RepID=UPI00333366C6
MREMHIFTETWVFRCLCCRETWQDAYEAHDGGNVVVWLRGGVPAMPPWSEPSCHRCRSLSVQALLGVTRPADGPPSPRPACEAAED